MSKTESGNVKRSRRRAFKSLVSYAFLITAAIIAFFPFYWSVSMSLRSKAQVFSVAYLAIPFVHFKPTLQNWIDEFTIVRETKNAVLNSLIVAGGSTFLALLIGSLAGYAIARFKYRRPSNQDLIMWFLSQRILPPIVLAIPFFLMMKELHLLDTRTALILAYTTFNLPLVVIIMSQIFRSIPEEIEESALVDGCTHLGVFRMIALPLASSGLVAVGMISFAFAWNEFLYALTLSFSESVTLPLTVAAARTNRGVDFAFVATRSLIAMGPPVVFALLSQRYLVRGLTFGAVKG